MADAFLYICNQSAADDLSQGSFAAPKPQSAAAAAFISMPSSERNASPSVQPTMLLVRPPSITKSWPFTKRAPQPVAVLRTERDHVGRDTDAPEKVVCPTGTKSQAALVLVLLRAAHHITEKLKICGG